MDANTQLAVIIACSLGGAALIVTLILIIVLCLRRKSVQNKKPSESTFIPTPEQEVTAYNAYSLQKSGVQPTFYPQFIGGGSLQWKHNQSMTTPIPVAGVEYQYQRTTGGLPRVALAPALGLPATSSTTPNQYSLPWNQRSIGRSMQAYNQNSAVFQPKRENGPMVLAGGYMPSTNVLPRASSRHLEATRPENRLSDVSTDSNMAIRGPDHYGSEAALITRDYNAYRDKPALHDPYAASRALNRNYVLQSRAGYDQSVTGSRSIDEFIQERNEQMFAQSSSASRLETGNGRLAQSNNSRYIIDASRQISRAPYIERNLKPGDDRVGLPAGAPASAAVQSQINNRISTEAVIESRSRAVGLASQNNSALTDEKKTINEAFMFLDDLEE